MNDRKIIKILNAATKLCALNLGTQENIEKNMNEEK